MNPKNYVEVYIDVAGESPSPTLGNYHVCEVSALSWLAFLEMGGKGVEVAEGRMKAKNRRYRGEIEFITMYSTDSMSGMDIPRISDAVLRGFADDSVRVVCISTDDMIMSARRIESPAQVIGWALRLLEMFPAYTEYADYVMDTLGVSPFDVVDEVRAMCSHIKDERLIELSNAVIEEMNPQKFFGRRERDLSALSRMFVGRCHDVFHDMASEAKKMKGAVK